MIYTYGKNTKSLTAEKNYEIFRDYIKTRSEDLKMQIFYGNLAFVKMLCKKYENVLETLTFDDIFIEGCIGLFICIDKYDPNNVEKCSFSTYASFSILQHIYSALNLQDKIIRLPQNSYQILKAYRELKTLNETLSFEEIAKELDVNTKMLTAIVNSQRQIISLDAPYPISEIEIKSLYEKLSEENESIEDMMIKKENITIVKKLMTSGRLSDREKEILLLRYGYVQSNPMSLEQIGKIYNISRERIRQIEFTALQKLLKEYRLLYKSY